MGVLYLNGDPASVGASNKNLISINEFDLSPSVGAYECNVNLPKGTYTLSFKIEGDIPSGAYCYISGQYFEYQSYSSLEIESTNPSKYTERNSVTFTADKNLKSIGIMIQKSAMPMPESITCHLAQIQLEKGSSMTDYVVYKSNLKIDGLAEEISATKDIIGKDNLGEGARTITDKLLEHNTKITVLESKANAIPEDGSYLGTVVKHADTGVKVFVPISSSGSYTVTSIHWVMPGIWAGDADMSTVIYRKNGIYFDIDDGWLSRFGNIVDSELTFA